MAAIAMVRRCCRIEWSQSSKNLIWVRWTGSVSLDTAATEVSGLDAVVGRAQNMEPVPGRGLPSLLTEDRRYNTNKHKVAIFKSEGSVTLDEKTGKELGVPVRDMPLFQRPQHHFSAAPRIAIRDDQILMRTELLRAVVQRDSLVLFECRKPVYSERVGVAVLHSLQAAREVPDNIPFEIRILEVLLSESMSYLEDRARRIKFISKGVETDITLNVNHADIRRLLPLQTAVTALEYDVRGMKAAIAEVAENEKLMSLLCLNEDQNLTRQPSVWTPHMQLAHRLLRAFDARVRTLDGHLRELTEHIDSTREVWHMQLDAMRNSIIRTNLHLQFAGVSTMAATLPAALFGMNLVSGWENSDGLFWMVSTCSISMGALIYVALRATHSLRLGGHSAMSSYKLERDALHELLTYNLDDVGDIVLALAEAQKRGGPLNKKNYLHIVRKVLGRHAQDFSREKLDLVFRTLDSNRDGFLDESELERVSQEILNHGYHTLQTGNGNGNQ